MRNTSPTRTSRAAVLTAFVGAAVLPILAIGAPASAAPGDTHVTTINYTGAATTFAVPNNAASLTIDLWGGDGGSITGVHNAAGGAGSHVTFTVPVAGLGSSLNVSVGGNGVSDGGGLRAAAGAGGGWNGGANGGAATTPAGQPGAGGGGRTEILNGSTLLGVAGGGGGGGGNNIHSFTTGAGGAAGAAPSATTADGAAGADGFGDTGGGGATASAAGAGGNQNGVTGVGSDGGAGAPSESFHSGGAGGGGGGLLGGGGGGSSFDRSAAGGGGGSSAVPAAGATNIAFAASSIATGRIVITWVEIALAVAPGAPTAASAAAGDGQATFSWAAPASDGGSAVLSYTVSLIPGGATCTATAPATTCTISGLANGTAYTGTVTATNAVGTSVLSETLTATPTAAAVPTTTTTPTTTTAAPAAVEPATEAPTELAFTGSSAGALLALGVALLVVGFAMTRRARQV